MPVYNTRRDHLHDAYFSLESQNLENIAMTIFIIDDCSTLHETKTWLQEFGQKENVEVFYRDENGGVAKALNYGLQEIMNYPVNFQFILRHDSDDICVQNRV